MRKFAQIKEEPLAVIANNSWIRGKNTLVSNTQIKDNELVELLDGQLVEDGKVQIPRDGQDYYGNTSGSRVTGIFPYYKSDGTNQLLRISATNLQVLNTTTNDWDNVSGATYTTTLDTHGVIAYDNLYLCNGTDALTKYGGSTITTFTEISAPNAPTVTRTGTTGSYTFSYKITALTASGETTGSTAGSTTLNQPDLDETSYMTVSWSAVTNATGYNVYGRKSTGWYFMKYLEGNSSTSFVDKGEITPSEVFTPPEGNSTGGQKGKYCAVYKDTLFVAGDPSNPSRLYYSGGGDKIDDFTIANGGGFIDISKNDGQMITGLIVFKDSLLVFKDRSIYSFSFGTTGLPQVQQVTSAVGAISARSIVAVENDIFFASDRGIFTVGNEEGFSFDVLRTREISARVRSVFQSSEPAYRSRISAVYATVANKNLVIFSYTPTGGTTNSRALVYDRERLAWYEWTNIQASCWANYTDSTKGQHVLYGDDASGYVKEILVGTDDFGSAIQGTVTLKGYDFSGKGRTGISLYKVLKNIFITLRSPTGTITATVIRDGVSSVYSANLGTVSPVINFGHFLFGKFLFGESYGSGVVTEQDNNIVRRLKNLNIEGRSFMLRLQNAGAARFTLLDVVMEARPKSAHYYKSGEVVEG